MAEKKRRARADAALVGLIFVAALAVRLLPFPAATAGGLRLLSPDCYGHLRRATFIARNFPRVPVFDPYLNHPNGGVWIWPPAFDLIVGGVARAAHGPAATTAQVARVAAALPPLLGALGVVPLFLFARRAFGRRRAFLAAAAYALLPAAAIWSQYGHADQHVAESFVLLLVLAASARAAAERGRGRTVAALAAGAALSLLLLTWQGAVASAAIALSWAALFLGPEAGPFGLAAAVLTAMGAVLTLHGTKVPFSFVSFGWFQPLFVAALTVPLTLLAALKARGRFLRRGLVLAAVATGFAVAPRLPELAEAARRGAAYVAIHPQAPARGGDEFVEGGYLSYPPEIVTGIFESRPLLDGPAGPALARAVSELSAGVLLLPFSLLIWSASVFRMSGGAAAPRRAARALAVLFGGAFLVLTLLQRRNVYYLAIFAALALGDAAARLVVRVRRGTRRTSAPGASGAVAAAAAIGFLALLEVLPGAPAYARLTAYAEAPGRDLLDLMRRLRLLDPPPVDPADWPPPLPGAVPGVMAPWSMGHFVTALAERPAAADPFVYGWRRQARLFTATDDAEAREILLGARCRYLVTTDLGSVLPRYALAAGRPPAPPERMFAVRVHDSAASRPVPFLVRVLESRTAARAPDGRLVPRFKVFRVDGGP